MKSKGYRADRRSIYAPINTTLAQAGYRHNSINHSAGEYAHGPCHVNSVEGFWARVKNSIRRTHLHVFGKHLQKYAKEFEYRYNRRKTPERMLGDLVTNL